MNTIADFFLEFLDVRMNGNEDRVMKIQDYIDEYMSKIDNTKSRK